MKIPRLLYLYFGIITVSLLPLSAARGQLPVALDFGDSKPETLLVKTWSAWGAKDYPSTVGYAQKCIDLYKKQALAQQQALTTLPTDHGVIDSQWALNTVGICYYLMGMALQQEQKKAEAAVAYNFVIDSLPYAQCFDPKGWYWKPADAAKAKLKEVK